MGPGWRNRPAPAAEQIGERGRRPPIRHMNHIDTGHDLKQLAGDVLRGPLPADAMLIFTRIGLGIGDELRNCFYWKR